jgi:hypothetical protein
MELIQWPHAARSMTCEKDRCVCVWLCISRHEDMAALQPCSDVSMMTVISVCVILHITSWRYGRIVTLFWCINDDCNMCVWFRIWRDMLLWLSLCSTIFCMLYLLTCKAWRTSHWIMIASAFLGIKVIMPKLRQCKGKVPWWNSLNNANRSSFIISKKTDKIQLASHSAPVPYCVPFEKLPL